MCEVSKYICLPRPDIRPQT